MKRPARLQAAPRWLLAFAEKNVVQGYATWFGVDLGSVDGGEWDDSFACIAGVTSGGAPFGATREELANVDIK